MQYSCAYSFKARNVCAQGNQRVKTPKAHLSTLRKHALSISAPCKCEKAGQRVVRSHARFFGNKNKLECLVLRAPL